MRGREAETMAIENRIPGPKTRIVACALAATLVVGTAGVGASAQTEDRPASLAGGGQAAASTLPASAVGAGESNTALSPELDALGEPEVPAAVPQDPAPDSEEPASVPEGSDAGSEPSDSEAPEIPEADLPEIPEGPEPPEAPDVPEGPGAFEKPAAPELPETSAEPSPDPGSESAEREEAPAVPGSGGSADSDRDGAVVEPSGTSPSADAVPSWALSGDRAVKGNIAMAEQSRLMERELEEHVEAVKEELGLAEDAEVSWGEDNMADVWAAYAIAKGMVERYPYEVEVPDADARAELRSIFWDMTSVSAYSKADGSQAVEVRRAGAADAAERLGLGSFSDALETLASGSLREAVEGQRERSVVSRLSDEEFDRVEELVEGVEGQRRGVLVAALSLEGKVGYFYGGKTHAVGWNRAWGQLGTVAGDETVAGGSVDAYGLDCSGFISWSVINAAGSADALAYIGEGTSAQWANSKEIRMADAHPGDLVFLAGPEAVGAYNHVGIVVSNDEGELTVVHCSGSADNVVVTDASMFAHAREPYLYGQEDA